MRSYVIAALLAFETFVFCAIVSLSAPLATTAATRHYLLRPANVACAMMRVSGAFAHHFRLALHRIG